jgi:hypothetical protein
LATDKQPDGTGSTSTPPPLERCCTWWVWKTRNLTFKGETLIVKIFLLAQMGFETEMRGIPEKYKKRGECFDLEISLKHFRGNS